jgi:hypothetical protein
VLYRLKSDVRGKDRVALVAPETDAPTVLARLVGLLAKFDGEQIDPAGYEPEEVAAVVPAEHAPEMIRLDTEDGMEAFKQALAASRAATASRKTCWTVEVNDIAGTVDFRPVPEVSWPLRGQYAKVLQEPTHRSCQS